MSTDLPSLPDDLRNASATTKLCYQTLANTDGAVSQRDLHNALGCSRKSIYRAMTTLIDKGHAVEVLASDDQRHVHYRIPNEE